MFVEIKEGSDEAGQNGNQEETEAEPSDCPLEKATSLRVDNTGG